MTRTIGVSLITEPRDAVCFYWMSLERKRKEKLIAFINRARSETKFNSFWNWSLLENPLSIHFKCAKKESSVIGRLMGRERSTCMTRSALVCTIRGLVHHYHGTFSHMKALFRAVFLYYFNSQPNFHPAWHYSDREP